VTEEPAKKSAPRNLFKRRAARGLSPRMPAEDIGIDVDALDFSTIADADISPDSLPDEDSDTETDEVEAVAQESGPAIDWEALTKPEPGLQGPDVIQAFVKRLPNGPGVYRMFNAKGDVLYVGKARSLKKRVANYAQGRVHSNRIARMVRETAHMEFVTTRTETEALLLEANLIKRLRPRFNVLLRDDKSFPYILVTGDHPAPAIFKHRGARARKGEYFGPFASAGAVGRTINALQRAFLLRTCTDSVYEGRTRPCLLYQIKRCSGPCTGEISLPEYAELVQEAEDFLSGKSQKVKSHISQAMQQA
jgi:excinuclease ABC subunit C